MSRAPGATALFSMSRAVIYERLRAGRLRWVKQERARRIPAAAIAGYIALLEREATRRSCRMTKRRGHCEGGLHCGRYRARESLHSVTIIGAVSRARTGTGAGQGTGRQP